MADTLRLHVGRARFAPCLATLLIAGAPAFSPAQGPTWNWARSMDAGNEEYVRDIAVEPGTGNIYVVGAYQTTTALVAPYGLPASNTGSVDAFLAKLDPSGNLIWSRTIGSSQYDAAMGVGVSTSGLVVITGYAQGPIPAIGLAGSGSSDAFVVAYNAAGAYQWAKIIGGPQWDEGTGVVCTGNQVVAYGTYSYHTLIGGVLSTVGLSVGRYYAYLNAYDLSGALQWSLTGVSDDNILSERITADATNVYVVGSTEGNTMAWRNALGATSTNANTTDDDALFCSSVTLAGTPTWTRMINNPGDADAECNGVAVGCNAVYITGHTHDGSVFPGGLTRTVGGVHDYWFVASLDRSTGTSNWVRTASSGVDHGADGYDVAVGRNGQLYVSGALEGTVTTDMGTTITGSSDQDIMLARFNTDGTAVWTTREVSAGDERALAIASSGGGHFAIGGWYEDALALGSASHPGVNGSNLFTASFTDPDWLSFANNPARFAQPGPFCTTAGPIDLNAYLSAYADTAVAFLNVASPQGATGAPNSAGAIFNTAGGWLVLDLQDTLSIGEPLNLTWRSQTNLVQAQMLVTTSVDGVNWTTPSTYTTTSSSYGIANHVLGAPARYVKVARHATLGTSFHLDAVRYFGSTATGGTWSGG
ncbi:MAG: hypothetical protein JNJ64_12725, partial [Flavobacteriales bacterium]|nr:hypothetical protein [Flavobacteriales bacterium]